VDLDLVSNSSKDPDSLFRRIVDQRTLSVFRVLTVRVGGGIRWTDADVEGRIVVCRNRLYTGVAGASKGMAACDL
jgi:hypothetical protein